MKDMLIIGIDASRALKAQRTGTEVHNAEIIKHMTKVDHDDSFRLYSSKPPFGDMLELDKDAKVDWRVMPFPRGWTIFRLSLEMLLRKPDVLFVPAHALPLICPRKSVVMIHDIGFDHPGALYKWTDVWYHRYAVTFAKYFAGHILTPSEFTKQDLHEKYHIPLNKMTVIRHGFNEGEFRPARKDETSPREVPYFYYVGRLEHKKNIVRMLKAFAEFKQKTNLPNKFLLAGKPAYGYDAIEAAFNELPESVQKDIEFLGYVSQDDSVRYLRHAQGLIYTTLFEGFGIPALEGFASGTPVITSNITSIPEVVEDAAITVDPTSEAAIAQAMIDVATKPELRADLIQKGNAQYKKFSWDKAARETLTVLHKVAGKKHA